MFCSSVSLIVMKNNEVWTVYTRLLIMVIEWRAGAKLVVAMFVFLTLTSSLMTSVQPQTSPCFFLVF